jgi:hypothetical protein
MTPASRSPDAVSYISDINRFLNFKAATVHLRQLATGQDARQFFVVHPEQLSSHRTKNGQVVAVEIVPFVFAEPVKKNPTIRQSRGNNRAAAPTFPTPGERDALLE